MTRNAYQLQIPGLPPLWEVNRGFVTECAYRRFAVLHRKRDFRRVKKHGGNLEYKNLSEIPDERCERFQLFII